MTVMSDEVHGVPEGTSCAYGGAIEAGRVKDRSFKACPVVYHSCAPVSINGTVPRNDVDVCDTADFEEKLNWPMRPTDPGPYDYSTYFYKGDPGEYSTDTSQLMFTGAPLDCPSYSYCNPDEFMEVKTIVPEGAGYASLEGTCAPMVTMEVEPFELGKLPSTPKADMSVEEEESATGGLFDQDDPCSPCEIAAPCFSVALCELRDPMSGEWSGLAAPCNDGAELCEGCYVDSPCSGFSSGADDTPATVDEAASGEGIGEGVPAIEETGAEHATASESDAEMESSDIAADSSSEKGQDIDYEPDSVSESNPSSSTNAGLMRLCGAVMLIVVSLIL